jgi:alpha-acetolactate decarboxylase
MPRKKKSKSKSNTKIIGIIILIVIIAVGVITWHDGLIGTTSIRDINQGDVESGTAVTIKGELTLLLGNVMTVSGDGGALGFLWEGTKPPMNSIIVVRGIVENPIWLRDVSSVEAVWIFS